MAYSPQALGIFDEWKKDDALVSRGASGILAVCGRKGSLNRQEVAENYNLLAPIITYLGFSVQLFSNVFKLLYGYCIRHAGNLPYQPLTLTTIVQKLPPCPYALKDFDQHCHLSWKLLRSFFTIADPGENPCPHVGFLSIVLGVWSVEMSSELQWYLTCLYWKGLGYSNSSLMLPKAKLFEWRHGFSGTSPTCLLGSVNGGIAHVNTTSADWW